jgi:UDPglucose 6-dehydrogenase
VPENLQLGSAIDSFFNQQVTVIGSDEQAGIDSSAELFGPLKSEKMPMSLKTAEMTKHVLNSYLALSISFGNEVGAICQSVGVDSDQVIRAVKKDRRVSPYAPMRQGPPFSGGTLARDLMTIRSVAKRNNVRSFLLDGVARANNWHKRSVVLNIVRMVGRPLTPKKIAILGLTYKTDTDTLRRSFAIETATKLRHLGATISSYDPNVKKATAFVHLQPSVFDAVRDADAAVIFTAWPEFQSLDYKRLKAEIKRPLVMDLPNVLNKTRAKSEGIRIVRA